MIKQPFPGHNCAETLPALLDAHMEGREFERRKERGGVEMEVDWNDVLKAERYLGTIR